MLAKTVLRTSRKSLGRYLAVLSIIALGVGFFAGLRVTNESMVSTLDGYLDELQFYDLELVSTLGLTEDDVKAFSELDGVKTAAGSVSADFIYVAGDGSDAVLHAHTMLDGMNKLDIVSGRYPEKADECVVDNKLSGAVFEVYVDVDGNPTMDEDFNPNGSYYAIEGITSMDGRILGKMAHSERIGEAVAENICGNQNQMIFESGVEYFK